MRGESSTGHRFDRGLSLALGVLLLAAGAGISPPGYALLSLGHAAIVSGFMRVLAWGVSTCLLFAGGILLVWRPRIQMANLLLVAVSCTISFLAAEGVLALLGVNSPYHLVLRVPALVPWITVDAERGARIVPGKYPAAQWPINRDGFADSEEFVDLSTAPHGPRVLFLGDSFTFGIRASACEKSFAGIVKSRLKEEAGAIVWNTAIPGIGQAQEWDSLREYFPLLAPDVVVLGFCNNDFYDNLYPSGAQYVFSPNTWLFRYAVDASGNARLLSPEETYRRAMMAASRPLEYVAVTRVGYLALTALTRVRDAFCQAGTTPQAAPGAWLPGPGEPVVGYERTRAYLRQIQEYVRSHDARLLLLLIPFESDLEVPGDRYKAAVTLCAELGIDCVELRSQMARDDYYGPPDLHFNDTGHRKVAEALLPRLRALLHLPGNN